MVLAHLGFSVCFTDQSNTLPIVKKNLAENKLDHGRLHTVEELNWGGLYVFRFFVQFRNVPNILTFSQMNYQHR
jgi:hypothetical protein